MKRHRFVVGASLLLYAPSIAVASERGLRSRLAEIERRSGGRLGVAALDPAGGRAFAYRGDERFAMCSTFKLLAVGAILARADRGEERLDRSIRYGGADLLNHAPVTRAHVASGAMQLGDLCEAAIVASDNTAANLIIHALGGPGGVTRFARSLGDPITRLDRIELALNSALPGDPRDTTTPLQMARNLHALLQGDHLAAGSRTRLARWLAACQTAKTLIPAGLPADWRSGNKTGTGGDNNRYGDSDTRNDVAVLWAPRREALYLSVYLTRATVAAAQRDAALADAARAAVAEFFS